MSDHKRFSQWSAAYVLGALDHDDRRDFERHLASCDRCQDEVRQFAPIPGLLARVEPVEEVAVPHRVLESAVGRARSEQRRLFRSRNRWRLSALVASIAAILLALVSLSSWTGPEKTIVPLESELSVSGQVGLETKAWGTAVSLEVEGLPQSEVYVAWAVDRSGEWQQIAAWGPIPGPRVSVEGACSWQVGELRTIVITTDDPEEVLASGSTGA